MITNNKFNFLWNIFMFLAVFSLFIVGCSKDDNGSSDANPSATGGGDAYRYESVLIEVKNTELSSTEYLANFGGKQLMVFKVDDHSLAFTIPANATLGNTEFSIPSLNNLKLTYNVLQPKLTQTTEETIAPLIGNFETGFTGIATPTIESSNAQNSYLQFKNYWDNTATNAEKEEIALWYKANKDAIDQLFLLRASNISGRLTSGSSVSSSFGSVLRGVVNGVKKIAPIAAGAFATCQSGAIAGAFSLTAGTAAFTVASAGIAIAGLAVASYGVAYALDYQDELIEYSGKAVDMAVKGIMGQNGKLASSQIEVTDNQMITLPFQVGTRKLLESDSNSGNELVTDFFSSRAILNDFIAKENLVFDWFNENKGTSYQHFNDLDLSNNSAIEQNEVTSNIMQNITFSLNHPNLQLVNTSIQSDGQLNLKLKIVGTPNTTAIISSLNYSYSDEISSFQGTFPLKVNYSLVGNWTLVSVDNTPVGQWDAINCPHWRTKSGSMAFTETIFSGAFSSESEGTKQDGNGNTICSDLQVLNDSFNGKYPSSGSSFTISGVYYAQGVGGIMGGTISIVNSNTIQVAMNLLFFGGSTSNTFIYKRN